MTPVEALQKALAAEHAAVHLYGVLGGQSSKSRQPTLFRQLDRAYDEHRASRDELTVLVSAKGSDPVAAKVDYAVPGPTATAAQIEAVARTIERRVTRPTASWSRTRPEPTGDGRSPRWTPPPCESWPSASLRATSPACAEPGRSELQDVIRIVPLRPQFV